MQKNVLLATAVAVLLSGCLGGGTYPAAQTGAGQDNAALIGSVITAMAGAQTANTQPVYGQQGYVQQAYAQNTQNNQMANVIGTLTGAQTANTQPVYAPQGYAQNTQNNQMASVIGALTGAQTANTQPVYAPQGYGQNNQIANVLGTMNAPGGMNVNQLATGVLTNQCVSYINTQPMWQSARMALGNQAQAWEGQICQCASQETLAQMNNQQLNQLAMSAAGGQAMLTQNVMGLMSQTAMSCLQRSLSQNMLMPR